MTTTTTTIDHDLMQLDPELLAPAPDNPRQELGDLDDLVASIEAVGLIEPIVVTRHGDEWMIVAGHRRHEAALRLGLDTVPCYVRADLDDDAKRTEAMLVENLVRANLNPIEEALGFERLSELGHPQAKIAERVGCNQSHVSKRIKLLKLTSFGRRAVIEGVLDVSDALKIATLPEDRQERLVGEPAWRLNQELAKYKRDVAIDRVKAAGAEYVAGYDPACFVEVDEGEATHGHVAHEGKITWLRERDEDDGEEVEITQVVKPTADIDGGVSAMPAPVGGAEARGVVDDAIPNGPERHYTFQPVTDDDFEEATLDDLDALLVDALKVNAASVDVRVGDVRLAVLVLAEHGIAIGFEIAGEVTFGVTSLEREHPGTGEEMEGVEIAPGEVAELVDEGTESPDEAPERPWSTYDILPESTLIRTIGNLDEVERLDMVLAYERACGQREDVVEAAIARIAHLEATSPDTAA